MLAFKFRPYPNKEEEKKLLWTKDICRFVCSRFLESNNEGENRKATLQALLPTWKKSDKDLETVNSKVFQYELYRLFSSFSAMAGRAQLSYEN